MTTPVGTATTDNIKVWGQEDGPRPRPADLAAMQAEIRQLKEDNARIEAELRRLTGGPDGGRAGN